MSNEQSSPLISGGEDSPAEEKLIWQGCPKWQADFGFIMKSVLLSLAGIVMMIVMLIYLPNLSKYLTVLFPLVVFFTGLGMIAWIRLKRRNERYKVTSLNLEYESGVFSKTVHNLEMWRIRDIEFHQSFFDRILGVSRIILTTTDPSTEDNSHKFELEGLPPGKRIFKDIKQAFQLARQRRNIIGMVD
ncbi:MAG: PH domain-containing protein [Deltaproteobacteria bacterium]|jgi:membrane protein YdbS with pleckstrin-like domain|nr:PH domain-containing protein [Deltaproteobacteria bacterium]